MNHLVCRSVPGRLLFTTSEEGRKLYQYLVMGVPAVVSACVMPDHVHLQTAVDGRRPFGRSLAAYAQWRNAARGERGAVFGRSPAPAPLATADKVRRTARYIHLNPCRAGLVADPLAWPLSSYREAVGLAVSPFRQADVDPAATHAYVSGDPSVRERGTLLPARQLAIPSVHEVFEAVAALTRCTAADLCRRGPGRSLFVRAARTLTPASAGAIAAMVDLTPRAVRSVAPRLVPAVRLVERVSGDGRFHALWPGDVRNLPTWGRYRRRT